MNIVFPYFGEGQKDYVGFFIKSIKRHMPDANIIQFTDMSTPQVAGTTDIVRHELEKPYHHSIHPYIVLKSLSESPVLPMVNVDADIVFENSIEPLLDGNYDIAICDRNGQDGTTRGFRNYNPYNGGFMITKNLDFWKRCHEEMCNLDPEEVFFMAGQIVIGIVIDSGEFKVRFLDGNIYNYTPKYPGECNGRAKVWHYKGGRKIWIGGHFSFAP